MRFNNSDGSCSSSSYITHELVVVGEVVVTLSVVFMKQYQ